MDEIQFKICHLYPDVLNAHGDIGNIICLKKRLEWRGISVILDNIGLGSDESLADYDLVFLGGSQDFDSEAILNDLQNGRADDIKAAIENGVSFLAICGGFQIMGRRADPQTNVETSYVGAVDMVTILGEDRFVGNYLFRCNPDASDSNVVGFENHSGKTILGEGVSPLGTILVGNGNNGEDGTEGVHYKNLIGTYCGGPVLPKNPHFCDHIIITALRRRYGNITIPPLFDGPEHAAHDAIADKLKSQIKKTDSSK